ncbi:MAG: SprT-like domain-containing protein [Chitinophagaceae bacterium]|nr:SprT-like domain-containing protein [Chitinophagaceae bacterium]
MKVKKHMGRKKKDDNHLYLINKVMRRFFIIKEFQLSFLFIGLLFSCNKHDFINKEDADLLESTRAWISNNSGIIKSNSLVIENASGLSTITLDFTTAKIIHSSKNNFVEYSFINKKGGDFQSNSVEEKPLFKVVIQVNKVTKEKVGRLISINPVSDSSQDFRKTKQFYYLNGKKANSYGVKKDNSQVRIYEGNNDNLISNNSTDSKKRSYIHCTPFSSTSYSLSCPSGINITGIGYDMVCVFKKKTNNWDLCINYGSDNSDDQLFDYSEEADNGDLTSSSNSSPNKDIIDSLQGYPCAQAILANMPSITSEVSKILYNVFGVNREVNILFTVNPNLPNSVAGQQVPGQGILADYIAKIELNPKYLTGTKDFIAATIIHESIHAYIKYYRDLYQNDNATFFAMFPIYAQYLGNEAQHNEMANNYVSIMRNMLQTLNPDLSYTAANALAWGGLENTGVWAAKPQYEKEQIRDLNAAAAFYPYSQAGINPHNFKFCY